MTQPDWFTHWFDTPYYALLYQQRDEREAAEFIAALVAQLKLKPGSRVLDIGCGRGRHALALYALGFEVSGIDLSPSAIEEARLHETDRLKFVRADMRSFDLGQSFDLVINLFTSFGYFQTAEDNLAVLRRVRSHLKAGGIFVLDYLNAEKVSAELVAHEHREAGGVSFDIRRRLEPGHIVKEINITEDTGSHSYTEKVQLFDREQLTAMLTSAGLAPFAFFGDYHLHTFDVLTSPRLILAARAV